MPRKKRRSLADTLRESSEEHEKKLVEASKVVRLIEKDDSQQTSISEETQQTIPTDDSNRQNPHTDSTGEVSIQSQQAYTADESKAPSQQTIPTHDINSQAQQSPSPDESDSQPQLLEPTVGTNSQNQRSVGSECWDRQSDPTDQLLDSTYESDTQIQHTDSQAKFLISAKPKIVKTKNQKVLYNFLAQNTKLITTYDDLSEYLEISNGTIRDILRKFERNGLISKEKYVSKDGVQGLHITLQQTVPTGNSNRPIRLLDSTVDSPSKIDRSSICLSKEGGSLREGVKQEQSIDPTDIDWSPEERLKNLTDNDIAFFWPNLHKSGFGTHQIQQILERLAKVGKQPDKVMRGLDHAEWELENGTMADKEGRAVKDPCSYVFNSLAKHGYYRRPAGYVSPEEQAEIDEKEEAEKREKLAKEKAKRLEQAAKEEKHAKFLEWKSSLSEEELSKILENKIGPTEPWLRQYWENNILASGS